MLPKFLIRKTNEYKLQTVNLNPDHDSLEINHSVDIILLFLIWMYYIYDAINSFNHRPKNEL